MRLDALDLLRTRGVCMAVEHYGQWGGGMPKVACLLAAETARLGVPVTVFTMHTTDDDIARSAAAGVVVRRMAWRRGHRWGLPRRALALAACWHMLLRGRALMIGVGLDPLAGFLLGLPTAGRLCLVECTEARPGNKFVSRLAIKRLGRGRGLLTPARVIEENARRTYDYQGPILRLPFWIEPPEDAPSRTPTRDFLYLGRKDPEKGLGEMLRALAGVVAAHPEATLTICGTGSDDPWRQTAGALGLGDRVSFTYVPDPSRVGDLVRDARWLVLPSYHEGYPLALLEAFARGRPVIATSVGAVPEMCGQSQAAVLVPPRDETALRQTMTSALEEDAAAYARRCEHARDLFQRLSGPEAVRANMRAALEQLASRPCSRHGERDR